MFKYVHILLVALVFISFTGRVLLAEFNPMLLQKKWLKFTPHFIDSLLLLTGIALLIQGRWLHADHDWLIAKGLILIAYIGLGMLSMRKHGLQRWLAASGALVCLVFMVEIAVNKTIFAFF
ncbi:SirB2 family protein [Methylomonas methanica]|uniref:Invasion gene expression up-regulator SirB n=1 Tax=Methylomonas methanica (strain DSM 25384 / MC09) TaxID=857087 RepID=G0A2B5_METMM|nr:SirB2 family protein [Methylomonas methanica]AEF98927.1 Invasion gene expression up-regulator SirB [Methylomonas methanica MC09]